MSTLFESALPSCQDADAKPSPALIMPPKVLESRDGAPQRKRLALSFDATGESKYIEVSRNDVLMLIENKASSLVARENTMLGNNDTEEVPSGPRTRMKSERVPMDIPAIHMRDLRKLDAIFSVSNEPSITVRHQVVLVNCDPIRAVVLRDRCLVFLPDGADSVIHQLTTSFADHLEDACTAFEFAAIEAILATICRVLSKSCDDIIPKSSESLDKMAKNDAMLSELENLRENKNSMSALESQVAGMRRMLMAFLDNEEDLRMLYLTKLYEEPKLAHDLFSFDTDEVESFFEMYLQDIYGSQTRVSLMVNNVLNTESIVMLKLDSKRNFLLSIDLSLTVLSTLIAVPTFVVGGFGMNLDSYLQEVEGIFWIIFSFCIVFVAVGYSYVINFLQDQGVNMSWSY
ncbi:Aste57867_22115 [Aphanomyces stellatus]|uniref:Magnesium transporter n=1 Tax=Aphanomyces stellatus TaxID=120398 RepID=A0A485LLC8_9STRA|nr:hypothetical protein As57867_022046 [Aphanomyces stellatus]VFT98783.1 Aste57867_22115 [Aphanomyces stellatus]